MHSLNESDDSQCSISSREVKQRACIYFYSDKSTVICKDIRQLTKTDSKWVEELMIAWDGVQERVRIVAAGGKDQDMKEAQEEFEHLMGKENMSPCKAIMVLHGERPAPSRRRRCPKMGSNVTNLAPIHFGEDLPPLADAIGNALWVQGDVDWFNSEAIGLSVPEPIGSSVPESVSIQRNISYSSANIEGRPSIDALLANAADDCEKGRILLQHARHFLKKGPSELTVLLHPSYNIYMQKTDKISAVTIETTPRKLQEQLLLKLFGREYIGGHSASGQRRGRGGNPATDVETMEAVDAYVKMKFKGQEVPRLSTTYNKLAKNVRVSKGYQAGKYHYVKRKAAKEASGASS